MPRKRKPKQVPGFDLPDDLGLASNCEDCGEEVPFVRVTNANTHVYCEKHQQEHRAKELQRDLEYEQNEEENGGQNGQS